MSYTHSGHLFVADLIELCLKFFGCLVGCSLLLLSGVSCIATAFYLCDSAGRLCVVISADEATVSSRNAKISRRKMRRSRRSEENQPVARFSRKIQQKRKRSRSRLESAAAKQLTTFEELRKAGCQLLSLFKMAKATGACKKKRTQIPSKHEDVKLLYSAGRLCVVISADEATVSSRNAKISRRKMRRSRRSEENQPVARFSRKIQQKRKRSRSRLESAAAKQLTTFEELRKAGCQLLSLFKMAKATGACKKKRTQVLLLFRGALHNYGKKTRQPSGALNRVLEAFQREVIQQRLYIGGDAH
ncbi:hypothetical protein F511_24455 [Dorcoceras hygrometricum]|uniref:Uncharacterized protein n=1 Tax=Dorcoceras hygrometricum TaxID=472368 RepID=A0A2Z7B8N3_9LAMI|nr:hypothetical protein F511_24455 [Dorcoceras hygrometricum]